jgi:toxin ParE1/3/4
MSVFWSATAVEQLRSLMAEQARESPLMAQRLAQRLTLRSAKIGETPMASTVNPEFTAEEVREVIDGPYRLVFLHHDDRVDMLAVLKSRS